MSPPVWMVSHSSPENVAAADQLLRELGDLEIDLGDRPRRVVHRERLLKAACLLPPKLCATSASDQGELSQRQRARAHPAGSSRGVRGALCARETLPPAAYARSFAQRGTSAALVTHYCGTTLLSANPVISL